MITRTVAATDGISRHVEEVGNGQPVVFVQGRGYAAWAWRSQRDAVDRVARAVVMDNRGAGRSDKPSAPYSIDHADDVASVIESCGGGPAMVVGVNGRLHCDDPRGTPARVGRRPGAGVHAYRWPGLVRRRRGDTGGMGR